MSTPPLRPGILYVITDLLTGGVPLHLRRLCAGMGERGYDCSVACLAPPGPVSILLQADGVPVTHLGARGAWDLRVIWRLRRHIRRARPDLVHCLLFHANMAGRVAGALARFPSRRLLCEIQTVEIERRWHLIVDGLTQELCGQVIGNSSAVVEHLAHHAHIGRHRLTLVRGGIDVSAMEAAPTLTRSTWSLPSDGPLLVWVGRLDPVKGLDDLIEAMVVVGKESNAHLALIGDGEYRAAIEALIARLRLGDRVTLLGRRDDVGSILKAADVFVFPSYTEGMPNALLEAMAAGLPVVASDILANREVLVHERTGLLAAVRNPQSIAVAILRLIADPDEAARLGKAAAKHVHDTLRIESCFDAYETLYQRTLADVVAPGCHR